MDKNLTSFVMIARTGNLTTAAERLNITQPTLTKRLQNLETAYGTQLVERLPRGIRLTREGKTLLPYGERIEQTHFQAREALNALQSGHMEELRIGAGPLFHLRYLGRAFDILQKEYPDTRLSLTADMNSRNLPRVRQGSLDLMFGTVEPLAENDPVTFAQLTNVEQGLLVSRAHPIAAHDMISPEDMAGLQWVVYSDSPENENMLTSYFTAHGLPSPRIKQLTSSFTLGLEAVADSQLAMIIPIQLAPILDPQRFKMLRPELAISHKPSGAFYRRSSITYPVLARLIELVGEIIDHPPPDQRLNTPVQG